MSAPTAVWRRRDGLTAAGMLILALVCYWPAIHGEFVWDDNHIYITQNTLLRSPDGLYRFFFTTDAVDYFPLTYATFWFEWRIWGESTTGYHLVNILLHWCASVGVWRIARRLQLPGAGWIGLLFLLHPAQVEAVAWISQRKAVLAAALAFAAAYAYLRFLDANGPRDGAADRRLNAEEIFWYALGLGLFLLALLAKQSVSTLPLALVGVGWWRGGRVTYRDGLRLAPWLLTAALITAVSVWFQVHNVFGTQQVRVESFWGRTIAAGFVFWFYLSIAVFPVGLTFVYPYWRPDVFDWTHYLPLLSMGVLFALLWVFRNNGTRLALAGMGYFLIALVPALGFADTYFFKFSLVADHYQYFALPGPLAVLVGSWIAVVRRFWPDKQFRGMRWLETVFPASLAIGYGVLTFLQAGIYRDEKTLWIDTLSRNPGCWLAHQNLGVLLSDVGDNATARWHFDEALRLCPYPGDAYFYWAIAQVTLGDVPTAIGALRRSIAFDEGFASAHHLLGELLKREGRLREARTSFRRSLELYPRETEARMKLAETEILLGNPQAAIEQFQLVLTHRPMHGPARLGLAQLLHQTGQTAAAAEQYRQLLDHPAASGPAAAELALILVTDPQSADPREAIRLAKLALREMVDPSPTALEALARAQWAIGQHKEALRTLDQALSLPVGGPDPSQRGRLEQLRGQWRVPAENR